jgi:hypothetical protein
VNLPSDQATNCGEKENVLIREKVGKSKIIRNQGQMPKKTIKSTAQQESLDGQVATDKRPKRLEVSPMALKMERVRWGSVSKRAKGTIQEQK